MKNKRLFDGKLIYEFWYTHFATVLILSFKKNEA